MGVSIISLGGSSMCLDVEHMSLLLSRSVCKTTALPPEGSAACCFLFSSWCQSHAAQTGKCLYIILSYSSACEPIQTFPGRHIITFKPCRWDGLINSLHAACIFMFPSPTAMLQTSCKPLTAAVRSTSLTHHCPCVHPATMKWHVDCSTQCVCRHKKMKTGQSLWEVVEQNLMAGMLLLAQVFDLPAVLPGHSLLAFIQHQKHHWSSTQQRCDQSTKQDDNQVSHRPQECIMTSR